MTRNAGIMIGVWAALAAAAGIAVFAGKARAMPKLPEPEAPPEMPTPEGGFEPYERYYKPFSISRNQDWYIWATRTGDYSAYVAVENVTTHEGGDHDIVYNPDFPTEGYQEHFDYLVSKNTLTRVDAYELGALRIIFGFKE